MNNVAVLVVDVQNGLMNKAVFQREAFLASLKNLLAAARAKGVPVIYVRHCDEKGGELEEGSDNWHIYREIAPAAGEEVVDKWFNSAFRRTDLKERLDALGIDTVILAGMMTEYCVDATCRAAFELDYTVVTTPELNTTLATDNGGIPTETMHRFFNQTVWNKRYALVIPAAELLVRLDW